MHIVGMKKGLPEKEFETAMDAYAVLGFFLSVCLALYSLSHHHVFKGELLLFLQPGPYIFIANIAGNLLPIGNRGTYVWIVGNAR